MLPRPYRAQGGTLWIKDIKTDEGTLRVMEHDGVYQSASYVDERRFELPFEYLRSFDHVFEMNVPVRRLLMIGGGGYAYPKHVLTHHDQVAIDVVELDPAFTKAARKHLFLDELLARPEGARLGLFEGDGAAYLRGCGVTYDAVINDAFQGCEPDAFLSGEAGARLVKSVLAPGGSYLVNVVADADSDELHDVVAALGFVFDHVFVIPAVDEELSGVDNHLVVASDADHPFSGVSEHRIRLTADEAARLGWEA